MKSNTKSNQSSVPVQHSHTAESAAAKTETTNAAPPEVAPRSDSRLPIDSEARKANRMLPTPKVLNLLHAQLPAVYRIAEVVGQWVWVQFKERPCDTHRQQLAQLGFHWNRERQAWQHPCGKFSLSSPHDPHEKYSSYRPASIGRSSKRATTEATA